MADEEPKVEVEEDEKVAEAPTVVYVAHSLSHASQQRWMIALYLRNSSQRHERSFNVHSPHRPSRAAQCGG